MRPNDWFTQESMIRQINQEALVLLGGGRAILLQLAHPLVAAGVAEYSDFQTDPLSRLLRTLELMQTIIFGNRHQARQALEQFHDVHARIRGRLSQASGRFPSGTVYSANDPELKLWVFATLVDTGLMIYERFVAPLTLDERRQFYVDTYVLAELLSIPNRILPSSLDEFGNYMINMLAGDTLVVTETAYHLGHQVLYPDVGIVASASALLLRFVTAGTLPERFRKAYGLKWNTRRQLLLSQISQSTRLLRPLVPAWVWQSPQLGGGLSHWLLWQTVKPRAGNDGFPLPK